MCQGERNAFWKKLQERGNCFGKYNAKDHIKFRKEQQLQKEHRERRVKKLKEYK